MRRSSRPLLIAAVLLTVSSVTLAFAAVATRSGSTAAATPPPEREREPAPLRPRSIASSPAATVGLLDGVPMSEAEGRERAGRQPVAVMVDNWVDARPQTGLDRAEVVYEALVEAGITRFMAVYWRNDAPVIEPVRSARTQFLGPALELDATYVHVGAAAEEGPADATTQMREWGVREIDEAADEPAITRDPKRAAPYNAVTSTEAVRASARQRGWTGAPKLTPWTFKADGGAAGPPVVRASFNFDRGGLNGSAFAVGWEYDPVANGYRRSQAGAPHLDGATGAQLTAKNVVLQFAEVRPAADRAGHVLYANEGTGKAIILLDGRAVEATWRKDSRTARTRYFDSAGREIAFNRGATWVELLATGTAVTLT